MRKSVEMFKVRVGDDRLFGFVKTRFGDESFQVVVKLAYVDCKGAAFEKMPPEVAEKIKRYVEENFSALFEREFSGLLR